MMHNSEGVFSSKQASEAKMLLASPKTGPVAKVVEHPECCNITLISLAKTAERHCIEELRADESDGWLKNLIRPTNVALQATTGLVAIGKDGGIS